jgi:hypothetical protein
MKMKIGTKTRVRILVGFCVLGLSAATAGTSKVEVRWNELSPLILGHTVSLVLPGGAAIAGEVEAVRDDSLALDVRKSSDSKVQPKGTASIPRASVTTLQMDDTKGTGGRILGVVVGVLVGMVAGGEIDAHASRFNEAAAVGTFTGVSIAGAVGGYYVGRSVDRHTTIIRVIKK